MAAVTTAVAAAVTTAVPHSITTAVALQFPFFLLALAFLLCLLWACHLFLSSPAGLPKCRVCPETAAFSR